MWIIKYTYIIIITHKILHTEPTNNRITYLLNKG